MLLDFDTVVNNKNSKRTFHSNKKALYMLTPLVVIASPKPCTAWGSGRRARQSDEVVARAKPVAISGDPSFRSGQGLLRRPAKRRTSRNDKILIPFVLVGFKDRGGATLAALNGEAKAYPTHLSV